LTNLVEDGLLGADETPLESLFRSIGQFDGVADVEELALVVDVSVVAVDLTVTRKSIDDVIADGRGVAW
jgi:hypothetical protein